MRRALSETHPHLKEFSDYLIQLNQESDRGAVLISAAMLDDLLSRTLQAFLIRHTETDSLLDGFNAPLGTLAARSLTALALGLISEREYAECKLIRKVRNRFAHNMRACFADTDVAAHCKNLTFAIPTEGTKDVANARTQFITSATSLILGLTNRPHYVSQQRRTYTDWPY